MRFSCYMKDDYSTPDWAREELAEGRCAIGRFWGQTVIYVPAPLCDRLDDATIYRLAEDVFTKERMERFRMSSIFRSKTYCEFEVPTSLEPGYQNQQNNPAYRKPDELVAKIMELTG